VSALRSVAFFDGAAAGMPILVLSIWLVAGLVLLAVGAMRRQTEPATPTSAPDVSAGV
jgi:type IV secretory pathway TrbD component